MTYVFENLERHAVPAYGRYDTGKADVMCINRKVLCICEMIKFFVGRRIIGNGSVVSKRKEVVVSSCADATFSDVFSIT